MKPDFAKEYQREKNTLLVRLRTAKRHYLTFLKWIVFAVLVGLAVGIFGSLFGVCMEHATETREANSWLILLMPVAGLFIVWLYRRLSIIKDGGTNTVIDTIHSGGIVPFKVAPLIFIATVLTHLTGGSAGREGAALQIGGSFGDKIGRILKLDLMDRKVLILCGMSAAFSALFGTPVAAAVFSMEVITVGVMYYVAFLPCVVASLVASHFASDIVGISPEAFHIADVPPMGVKTLSVIILVSIISAVVSSLFCWILHHTSKEFEKRIPNQYIRVVTAAILLIVFTFLAGNHDYNGTGIDVIKRAFQGNVVPYAFLLKIVFTAVTLGGGFKGGEIIPTFFIGATLGAALGNLCGVSPSLCAAVGMAVLFCSVTNCPLATLFISFELFDYKAVQYFLLAIAIGYVLSGYSGLYGEQKIMYSKYKAKYINRNVKDE